jgi:hypothetical protein
MPWWLVDSYVFSYVNLVPGGPLPRIFPNSEKVEAKKQPKRRLTPRKNPPSKKNPPYNQTRRNAWSRNKRPVNIEQKPNA